MSPRPSVGPRLRRVLALVPYLAAHPGVTLDELAGRFGIGVAELERDLEVLPFCGLPPYSPDRLIDVQIVDGRVSVRFAEYFARPLRLSPAEGLALLAAGRMLLTVPGSDPEGPLATALAKLERALDVGAGVRIEVGEPEFLDRIRAAVGRGDRLEIDYYSFGRDELTTRRIDPTGIFHALGAWYVAAYCHRAHDERLFRLDRIHAVRETGERFEVSGPDEEPTAEVFSPAPTDLRVTLDLAPAASWVAEAYPTEEVEQRPDGSTRVRLAVGEPAWLARLLLRLGPEATVLEPTEAEAVRTEAAARVLARYRS